jgi:hypothetical protein
MRLDVSGRRPWPGPEWDAYTVALSGRTRIGRWGLWDGDLVLVRDTTGDPRSEHTLFGYSVMVTPPGYRPRRDARELVVSRIEVAHPSTAARLTWVAAGDKVVLEFRSERRKHGPATLLDALPLLMERPRLGRPIGSVNDEDGPALQAIIDREADRIAGSGERVSWAELARSVGMDPSTMSRKRKQYGLTKLPI